MITGTVSPFTPKLSRSSTTKSERKASVKSLGLNCLVTNISSYPAQKPEDIPPEQKSSRIGGKILKALMELCKPRVILFHGRHAETYGSKLFGVNLDLRGLPAEQFVTVKPWYDPEREISLFATVHLSGRGISRLVMANRLEEFARVIRVKLIEGDSDI
jgi:uracil-DNA glycosylase